MEKVDKQKAKIKTVDSNNEVYSFLELLKESEYFGEVTLFFRKGNIEFTQQKVSLKKSDIRKYMKNNKIKKDIPNADMRMKINREQLIFPLFITNNKNEE